MSAYKSFGFRCACELDSVRLALVCEIQLLRFEHRVKRRVSLTVDFDIVARKAVLQIVGSTLRYDFAVVHNDNRVRVVRLLHVVRGEKDGHSSFAAQPVQDVPDMLSRLRVQARRGFVQEKQIRPVDESPCDVGAAALSARQFAVRTRKNVAESEKFRKFVKTLFPLGSAQSVIRRSDGKVVLDGQPFVKHGPLKNNADSVLDFFGILSRSNPSITTFPSVFFRMVQRMLIVVVLPAPFSPRNAKSSPLSTRKEMPFTARTSP